MCVHIKAPDCPDEMSDHEYSLQRSNPAPSPREAEEIAALLQNAPWYVQIIGEILVGTTPFVGTYVQGLEIADSKSPLTNQPTSNFWRGVGVIGLIPVARGPLKFLQMSGELAPMFKYGDEALAPLSRFGDDLLEGCEDLWIRGARWANSASGWTPRFQQLEGALRSFGVEGAEFATEHANLLDRAENVCNTTACRWTSAAAGLLRRNQPRAVLEIVTGDMNNPQVDHAVLVTLDEAGNLIVIDNTQELGRLFGSNIPLSQYLQNIAERTKYRTTQELVALIMAGELPKSALKEYTLTFPQPQHFQIRLTPLSELSVFLE